MRKPLALAVATASTVGLGVLVPTAANAACSTGPCSQDTTVTFTLSSSNTFKINQASNAVTLASQTLGTTGAVVSGALPATTVTDGRAQLAGVWTVNISSTAFSDGNAGDPTIGANLASASTNLSLLPASNNSATSGGTAVVTYTPVASLAVSSPLVAAAAVQGVAVTSYTPSMSIAVPPTAVAGTYTGTVTQTLS
jgi:hypothetical protein